MRMGEVEISVLGVQKDGGWEAIALEMDLTASASTIEKALEDLKIQIENQLSFAQYKNDPEMAFKSAPFEYFTLYAHAKAERMRRIVSNTIEDSPSYIVGGIPMPPAHVIAEMTKDFSLVNAWTTKIQQAG